MLNAFCVFTAMWICPSVSCLWHTYREQAVTGHLYTITENKGQQDRSRQTKHSYSTSYYNSSEYNQGQSPHTHTHTVSISRAAAIPLNASLFLFTLHSEKEPSGATHTHMCRFISMLIGGEDSVVWRWYRAALVY